MLTKCVGKLNTLAYGKYVLSYDGSVLAFGSADLELAPVELLGTKVAKGTLVGSIVEIEGVSKYTRLITVGVVAEENVDNYERVAKDIGIWIRKPKGWAWFSSDYRLPTQLKAWVSEQLDGKDAYLNAGVRVTTPRGGEQLKIERLAEICGLTDGRWVLDDNGKEIYITTQYTRGFNPYSDDSWVWEIIKRVGLTVHHKNGRVVLTHPIPEYQFEQQDYGVRPLRQQLCEWLLDTETKRQSKR